MATTTSSFFTWEGQDFWASPDGNILCDQCGQSTMWCEHLESLTIMNGDAEMIWEIDEPAFAIQIPMFPTSGLWARAQLIYVSKLEAYKVGIDTDEATECIWIGHLHSGEGRNIIRTMILDWFEGSVVGDGANIKCMSASHKVVSETLWQGAMKDRNLRLAEQWCVWDTHSCRHCANALGDISDLIPDASSTRRSVF